MAGVTDPVGAGLAVVVGAGPGLGLAVADRFAREGYRLALLARNPNKLDISRLSGLPGPAPLLVAADVGDARDLRDAFATIRSGAGDPDVLVYNTSLWVPGKPTELDYDAFMAGLRVGAAGALVAVQEVAPAMRAAGRGTILLTGSGVALRAPAGSAGLAAAKAALRSLALTMADELRTDGIHVATVTITGVLAPGTFYDPELIAQTYWDLHVEGIDPPEEWHTEVIYADQGAKSPARGTE
jgi:NAD(P)-dependent dehydrogenase (short-subunit alcohol dehydrogenase family)